MIIEKITLNNFQCFYGKQEIILGPGCNVIQGRNGTGKSRLFNAFLWCFNNRYYETNGGMRSTRNETDYFNLASRAGVELHESFEVSVEIAFALEDTEFNCDNIRLKRFFTWANGGSESQGIQLTYRQDHDTHQITDHEQIKRRLDDWIDLEFLNYMWFQGEALDELVKLDQKGVLQSLTAKISHYSFFEDLVADGLAFKTYATNKLVDAQTRYSKDAREAIRLNSLLKKEKTAEKDNLVQLDAITESLSELNKTIERCDSIIALTAESSDLLNKWKDAERNYEKKRSELTNRRETFSAQQEACLLLAEGLDVSNYTDKIPQLNDFLNQRKFDLGVAQTTISMEIPKPEDLKKLIDAERCDICGTEARTGSEAYKHMVDRLNQMLAQGERASEISRINQLQAEIPEILFRLEGMISTSNQLSSDFESDVRRLAIEVDNARHSARIAKEALGGKEGKGGDYKIAMSEKEKAQNSKVTFERRYREIEGKVKNNGYEIDRLQKQLSKLADADELDPIYKKTKDLADYTYRLLSEISASEFQSLLNEIEQRCNIIYQDLLKGSEGVVSQLKINRSTLTLELIDQDGIEGPDPNSANADAAKVALITSVLELAKEKLGLNLPLISDAATSKMDSENAVNFALVTKKIFKQSVVISKDINRDMMRSVDREGVKFFRLNPMQANGEDIVDSKVDSRNLMVNILVDYDS